MEITLVATIQEITTMQNGLALVPSNNEPTPGNIYILERDDGCIKIGCSTKVEDRLRTLINQGGILKSQVRVSPSCLNYRKGEAYLHALFKERRTCGEWFAVPLAEADEALQSFELITPDQSEKTADTPPLLKGLSVNNLSHAAIMVESCLRIMKAFRQMAETLGYKGKSANDYVKRRFCAIEGFENLNKEIGILDLTTVNEREVTNEQLFKAVLTGDLTFFIEVVADFPPSKDVANIIDRWTAGIGQPCKIPRNELQVIYAHFIEDKTLSASQFGRLCGVHGVKMKSIRTHIGLTKGITTTWKILE